VEPVQIEFFRREGYLRLEGFHARSRMSRVRQSTLDELKRLRIWASGKNLPSPLHALPPFQQVAKLSTLVKVSGMHEALMTPELATVVSALAGRVPSATQEAQLLLSLPHQGAWTLEHLNWHVDVAAGALAELPGIQVFVLVDDVAPFGGGTLALARSHRARHSEVRESLRKSGDLHAGLVELDIALVEMSGRAGDVFLMDMRLLHTPSINSTKHVRMMATARFFLGH
jgi:hypothetical protein